MSQSIKFGWPRTLAITQCGPQRPTVPTRCLRLHTWQRSPSASNSALALFKSRLGRQQQPQCMHSRSMRSQAAIESSSDSEFLVRRSSRAGTDNHGGVPTDACVNTSRSCARCLPANHSPTTAWSFHCRTTGQGRLGKVNRCVQFFIPQARLSFGLLLEAQRTLN
ncbi:unannotated protein [freshwater metagenome]|uniref:Unannotated protein n=1 Tax=freshwater metagenome TaxID=449393 RepID=A0A6J6D577_9ZZZZ